jgi:predicted signal transduction protein with EAL and GGDEF domain
MPVFFRSRAGRQWLLLVALGAALWAIGAMLEFGDWLAAFVSAFDSYGADKLVLALAVGGTMSFVYSVLRIADLRKEMELRARAEAKADWTATHDHLTKLPNRYAFERKVVRKAPARDPDAISEDWERNVTIFCVDLDGFKKVNDLIGHNGGDALADRSFQADLRDRPRRLRLPLRRRRIHHRRNWPFRSQHEERFARLLIQAVTRPVYIDGFAVEVGASVGYDRWRRSEPLEHAAHRADLAMYEAKSRGPNHYLAFETSMHDKVAMRASLEAKLRIAIQKKAILPFYQPLIDLKTSNVCGFEALARWTDDDGANISPPVFIGIAEETGLITALFEDLLAQACRDAPGLGRSHLTLSFNVSPVQMEDRLLTTRIFKRSPQPACPPTGSRSKSPRMR